MLPEYRGYGKSEGKPSEAAFYEDAEVAMDFLRQKSNVDKIVIFGRSLGEVQNLVDLTHTDLWW